MWERRLCAAIFVAILQFPALAAAQADEAALRAAELEQLRERIEQLREALDRDLGRRDAARAALRDSEQTVARQAAILRGINDRLVASRARLEQLRADHDARSAELQRERTALAGQLRAAHALGREQRLKLLLNQHNPATVGRTLVYYDYLNRARVARIEQVATLLDEVATLADTVEAESVALAAAHAAQAEAVAALARTRDQRAAAIAAIERELRSGGQRLQQLEADEQRLLRLLESLSDLLADVPANLGGGPPFGELRGRLAWPARGEATRSADGVLIAAPAGSAVHAVAHGRIAWAGWMPHYGNLMVIEHGDDYFSLYAHNQTLLREVGEWVQAGETIARVGDSGGRAQPALYFELREGRSALNPRQWLER